MAVQKVTTASSIGDFLANVLRKEPAAVRLWVDNQQKRTEFWLVTEPITADIERHLYGKAVRVYEQFPAAAIQFHLVNPRYFDDFDVTTIVPAQAEEIRLR